MRTQNIAGAGAVAGCACPSDQPNVNITTKQGKDRMGYPEWKVQIKNEERQPVFVTLATGECVKGSKDFDTYKRNIEIQPGCSQTVKLPKDGNGIKNGAGYRATVRNCRNVTLGVVEGKFSNC